MRCAEHTLQLGIRDVLKKGRAEKFLTKLRKLAQHLRSTHTDGILKRRANKEMLIDMPTLSGSTFLMLQRLANLKCLVQNLSSHESYCSMSASHFMELPCQTFFCRFFLFFVSLL